MELLLDFYRTFIVDGTRYEVGTWDEAEGIKIFYNTFISTKVALVNMIQDVAERSGNMNVDVVTKALERSTYRITGKTYMKAVWEMEEDVIQETIFKIYGRKTWVRL